MLSVRKIKVNFKCKLAKQISARFPLNFITKFAKYFKVHRLCVSAIKLNEIASKQISQYLPSQPLFGVVTERNGRDRCVTTPNKAAASLEKENNLHSLLKITAQRQTRSQRSQVIFINFNSFYSFTFQLYIHFCTKMTWVIFTALLRNL